MKYAIWAVDFDGTIADDKQWPIIGAPIPKAAELIRRHYQRGGYVVINSCRHHENQERAKQWLIDNNVPFHKFNENLDFLIAKYGDCRKIGADLYIDDKNPGGAGWDVVERIAFDEEPFKYQIGSYRIPRRK